MEDYTRNTNGFRFHSTTPTGPIASGTMMDVDNADNNLHYRSHNNVRSANNSGEDECDIVVPHLLSDLLPKVNRNGNSSREGPSREGAPECSSDAKSWFWQKLKKSPTQTQPVRLEIQAGTIVSSQADDSVYNMDQPQRGRCVIFNHVTFDKTQGLSDRMGSDADVNSIQSTFRQLGFDTIVFQDKKFDEIMTILKEVADEDHSQRDCLAVFVLTHGLTNELHAYDITYKPSSLWSFYTADKCSTLAGKPKMFFLQACRGDAHDDGTSVFVRTQVDGPKSEKIFRIPNQADFLMVFSTYEGYYSWRNSKHGSWFIQALCNVFNRCCHCKDVLSMLTLVNREVATTYESKSKDDPNFDKKKQTPHVCHTLMRDIYLYPKYQSTLV